MAEPMEWFRCFSNEAMTLGGASPPRAGAQGSPPPRHASPAGSHGGSPKLAGSPRSAAEGRGTSPARAEGSPAERRAKANHTLDKIQNVVPALLDGMKQQAVLKDRIIGELRAQLAAASPPRYTLEYGDMLCEGDRITPAGWHPEVAASTEDEGDSLASDGLDAFVDHVVPSDDGVRPAGLPSGIRDDEATESTDDLDDFLSKIPAQSAPASLSLRHVPRPDSNPASPTSRVQPGVASTSISPVRLTKPSYDLPNFEQFESP